MQSLGRLLITLVLILASGLIIFKIINISPTSDDNSITTKTNTSALFTTNFVDILGHQQALKQWQGKTLLINFWATWCPPCREEMPELSNIQDKFHHQDFMVLGISTDDMEKTKAFIKSYPVSYPILVGDIDGMDLSQALGNNRDILPYSVLINRDGTIVKIFQGRINSDEVEQAIQASISP